jgi:thiamine biosynthesis protein ThiS
MEVNGRSYPHREGLTLHALLEELKINAKTVAVMHGHDFHRSGHIPDAPITETDVLEIVTMMQGG